LVCDTQKSGIFILMRYLKAFRTKPYTDLWTLADDLYRQAREEAVATIRLLYTTMMYSVETTDPEYIRHMAALNKDDYAARMALIHHRVVEEFGKSQAGPNMSPYDLSVSIAAYPQGDRIILVPHCIGYVDRVLNFLGVHPQLEDFRYWDDDVAHTDVQEDEWNYRKEVWRKVEERGQLKLNLDIIAYPGFSRIDPFVDLMDDTSFRTDFEKRMDRIRQLEQGTCPDCGKNLKAKDSLIPGAKWASYRCADCGFSTRVSIKINLYDESDKNR
jgi:hypothetical protein